MQTSSFLEEQLGPVPRPGVTAARGAHQLPAAPRERSGPVSDAPRRGAGDRPPNPCRRRAVWVQLPCLECACSSTLHNPAPPPYPYPFLSIPRPPSPSPIPLPTPPARKCRLCLPFLEMLDGSDPTDAIIIPSFGLTFFFFFVFVRKKNLKKLTAFPFLNPPRSYLPPLTPPNQPTN